MRILHVIDSLSAAGGSERQLVNNLQHFSDPEMEHRVAYLDEWAYNVKHLVPAHIQVECLFQPGERRRDAVRSALRLRRVMREWRPDLVHCSLARASLACRLATIGLPVVLMQSLVRVGYEPDRFVDDPYLRRWKVEAYRRLDMATSRKVRLFHAVSQTVAESWVRTAKIPQPKIRVVPRGVDVEALETHAASGPKRGDLLQALGLTPDGLVLVAVGRQEAPKGHRYLLEALHLLGETDPPIVLLVAGRAGNVTADLERTIDQFALRPQVRMLGQRDDVPALLAMADLFVFPSLHEGMPGALLEAMALGCPCVASAIGPVREIVTDGVNAVLVPPRDAEALARAISVLQVDTDLRLALGTAAMAHVREHFSAQVAASRLEMLYREAVGND